MVATGLTLTRGRSKTTNGVRRISSLKLIILAWTAALVFLMSTIWNTVVRIATEDSGGGTPTQQLPLRSSFQSSSRLSSKTTGSFLKEQPTLPSKSDKENLRSSTNLKNKPPEKKAAAKVAHAISFLNCGSKTSSYKDAMLILRHSIHQNSIHSSSTKSTTRKSKYDYQMMAFVNSDPTAHCVEHVDWIQRMGYQPLLLPNPINVSAIQNQHFRDTVDKTGVTGSSELIKLYLYTLTEYPVVVHWDIDVLVLKPMDDLFDAILCDKDSKEGREARSRITLQQPLHQTWPDRVDAFFTRDIALARPWENRQVAQGGFIVVRPNREVFDSYISVVHEANYSARCDSAGGWGGLGYGCKMGAMHYQGVVAYFYDHVAPGVGHGVELDACAWNQVANRVIYYGKKEEWNGMCQQSPIYGGNLTMNRPEYGACHDCRIFPVENTMTAHYTACSKPWQCRYSEQEPEEARCALINATTCGLLFKEFYKVRQDLEEKLAQVLGSPVTSRIFEGEEAFHPEFFLGYCGTSRKANAGNYVGLDQLPEDFRMEDLYGF